MTVLDDVAAYVTARHDADAGAVVRVDAALAEALTKRWGAVSTTSWLELPEPGAVVVLGDAPGHLEQGVFLAAVATLGLRPLTVVLTGSSHDAVPPAVGRAFAPSTAPAARGARLEGLRLEANTSSRVEALTRFADQGDLLEASVRWRQLRRDSAAQAADHAWIELQRLLRSGRYDEVLPRAMGLTHSEAGRGQVLLMVASARYFRGEVDPWLGLLERLGASDDPHLAADARSCLSYLRHDLEYSTAHQPPATSWRLALGEASLVEAGRPPGDTVQALPGRFGDALRAFFGLDDRSAADDPATRRRAASLAACAAGHPCDGLAMLGPSQFSEEQEAYRESLTARAVRRSVQALNAGDLATVRHVLSAVPHEARAGHDVWANSLAVYELVVAAIDGPRAALVSALADATRRFPHGSRRASVRNLWSRFMRCGGSDDPWVTAKVAGWALERLHDADAIAMSSQTLPSLPARPVALGPYVLEQPIGRGGMGTVWRGHHAVTRQTVAVKVLGEGHDAPEAEAFAAEVELTSRLEHPAIVAVLDHGLVEDAASLQSQGALTPGQPYLVLEYVDGGTLSDHVGQLDAPSFRTVAEALLDALAYAHARGVLHRDLKPDNVLVTPDGAVRLSDFGLSAYRTDRAAGTPNYMAPEQFRGAHLTPRTDLYGLGCLLWHLVSGRPLFDGPLAEVRTAHMAAERPPLAAQRSMPEGLEGWLHTLVACTPSFRFHSAAAALHALRALDGAPLRAATAPAIRRGLADSKTTFVMETVLDGAEPLPVVSAPHTQLPAEPPAPHLGWRGRPQVPSPRMADRGDPAPVAHRAALSQLWQALREVQATGAPRRVALDAPWGSVDLLVDELVVAARRHGVHVGRNGPRGALAVVRHAPAPEAADPWLLVVDETGEGAARVPPASAVEQLRAVARRLPLDRSTAFAAVRRSAGHPAALGPLLAAWSLDPGYRLGPGGLHRLGRGMDASGTEAFWSTELAKQPPHLQRLLAIVACADDGTPRSGLRRIEAHTGASLDAVAAEALDADGRIRMPVDLRSCLLRRHAGRVESFHAELAESLGRAHPVRQLAHQLRSSDPSAPRRWVERVLRRAYLHADVAMPSSELLGAARQAFDRHLDPSPEHRAWLRLWALHVGPHDDPAGRDLALRRLAQRFPSTAAVVAAVRWQAWAEGVMSVAPDEPPARPLAKACAAAGSWQAGDQPTAQAQAREALAAAEGAARGRVASVLGRGMAGADEADGWLAEAVSALPTGPARADAAVARGTAALRRGERTSAADMAAVALRADPDDAQAWWLQALLAPSAEGSQADGLERALQAAIDAGSWRHAGQLLGAVLWARPSLGEAAFDQLQGWALPVEGWRLPDTALEAHPVSRHARLEALRRVS